MATHNLPQYTTPFIGRQRELAEIVRLLDESDCRLLTLVGPGGIGKTRLALEIAYQEATRFQDGVYFVPLQPLQAVDNIVTAIVDVLPLQLMDNDDSQRHLLDYLREKHLLLVLDNFEHLLNGVEIVIDILNATTRVQLLVTSRARLNLRAEQVWPVTGLDVPLDIDDAPNAHSAVQLFADRARRVRPHFLVETHKENVIRICRLVEGLPLALELAATWIRVLDCEAIADEVQHNIDVLISNQRDLPERHQSMRAVLDHSWRLLTEEERAVLPKLAVFRGGFTVDAAWHVAGASLHLLASLIDKSLLRLKDDGRYDLHELLRQYAHQQLTAVGETEKALDTHCTYFLKRMQGWEADLKGLRQIEALDEIEADFENVRIAWQRAVQFRKQALIAMSVECLFLFCSLRSHFQDHKLMFEQALSQFPPDAGDEAAATWGRILVRSYPFLTISYTEPQPEAVSVVETALRIAQAHHDELEIALCLYLLAQFTLSENEAQGLVFMEESLPHFVAGGDVFYRAYSLLGLAGSYSHIGQLEISYKLLREAVDFCHAYDLRASSMGLSLSMFGMTEAFGNGNYIEGEGYVREAVNLYRSMNSPGETARILRWLSSLVFVRGDFDEARNLVDECHAVARDLHYFQYLGGSSAILGMIYNMQEDYCHGETYSRESLRHSGRPPNPAVVFSEWSLSCALCGLGDFEGATGYLRSALHHTHNMVFQSGFTALCAPVAAYIHAHGGNPERSVELLSLAFTHPKSPAGWLRQWPLITRLRANLEVELGKEAFAAAWEHGMTLDPKPHCVYLLHEFGADMRVPSTKANQSLAEMLSEREMEVLTLIADGLTNHEIARQLFIGVSTVKKHIQHIYGKLDAKNRTGAVLRARELNLLS